MWPRTSSAFFDSRFFDVDPVVLTRWIWLYLHHLELRGLLGSGTSAERLVNLLPQG